MKNIVVLGAGLVGRAMAIDLSVDYSVTAVDLDKKRLQAFEPHPAITTRQADILDPQSLAALLENADLVIGAVPGFMGYQMLKQVIELEKNIVDISFFSQDALELNALAQDKGVVAVVDCGVAPGMSNLILGYHDSQMSVQRFECYVGGLPQRRHWPFEYKAPFSPIDVIEEYTRPARLMENGRIVERPALTEPELLEFAEVGTLEAFNTDGLRSLLYTMGHVPDMKEKTLRYPGHINYIRMLRDSGFFDENMIAVGDVSIRPIDLTAKLLLKQWELQPHEPEFTIMRIVVEGQKNGAGHRYTYSLFDQYDADSGISSMARTTGYACTSAARLVLEGKFDRKGVSPPEYLGAKAECFHEMMELLRQRGIVFECREDK